MLHRRRAVAPVSEPWHLGLMLAVSMQATSADPETGRIVTACTAWLDGSGKSAPEVGTWLAWPEAEIPADVTRATGVSTASAYEQGLPAAQVAGELTDVLLGALGAGIPVVAFGAAFTLTLIDREASRYELDPVGDALAAQAASGPPPLVVDPGVLDLMLNRGQGPRLLADVAARYGIPAGEPDAAGGDALTAARVAWRIARRNPRLARMGTSQLMTVQRAARAEQARSYAESLRRQGLDREAAAVDGSWPWRARVTEGAAA